MKTTTMMSLGMLLGASMLGVAQESERPKRPQGPPPVERIKEFDKDGDGKLSEDEKKAMHVARRAQMEARRKEMLERFDADKDGKLNDDERNTMRDTIKAEMIEKYDKDGDGKLSEEERANMPKRLMRPGGPRGRGGPGGPGGPPGGETE